MTKTRAQCRALHALTDDDGRSRRIRCERSTRSTLESRCGGPHRAETGRFIETEDGQVAQVATWE